MCLADETKHIYIFDNVSSRIAVINTEQGPSSHSKPGRRSITYRSNYGRGVGAHRSLFLSARLLALPNAFLSHFTHLGTEQCPHGVPLSVLIVCDAYLDEAQPLQGCLPLYCHGQLNRGLPSVFESDNAQVYQESIERIRCSSIPASGCIDSDYSDMIDLVIQCGGGDKARQNGKGSDCGMMSHGFQATCTSQPHPPRGRWDSTCLWSSDPDTSCSRGTEHGHRRIRRRRSRSCALVSVVQVGPGTACRHRFNQPGFQAACQSQGNLGHQNRVHRAG